MSLAVLAVSLVVLPAAGQVSVNTTLVGQITVTTTADNTTAGDGACTLREAITNANSNSDTTSGDCASGIDASDTIGFSITPLTTFKTIQLTSALPAITEGVEIDGTTQNCGTNVPCIELDGTSAGLGVDGLTITGAGSTIRGLVINRFSSDGIEVNGIGGGNVISGNGRYGISAGFSGSWIIQGNYIGTDASGTAALGNSGNGIIIWDNASNNTVGGTAAGAGNVISGNDKNGIVVASYFNTITRNAIFSNTLLGIDLGGDGPTANDAGDPDDGANRLQNFPVLSSAVIDGSGDVEVTYLVDTDPANATFPLTVEFFRADAGGEGEAFLGADTYTTSDHSGCGSPPCEKTITFTPQASVTGGDEVVATATDADGNTSEFSAPFALPVPVTRYVARTGSDAGNDCTNEASPCQTVSHAVAEATRATRSTWRPAPTTRPR